MSPVCEPPRRPSTRNVARITRCSSRRSSVPMSTAGRAGSMPARHRASSTNRFPSPAIRANVATVLGALGDAMTVASLQPLTGDKDRGVAQAATRAIERIKQSPHATRSPSSF